MREGLEGKERDNVGGERGRGRVKRYIKHSKLPCSAAASHIFEFHPYGSGFFS